MLPAIATCCEKHARRGISPAGWWSAVFTDGSSGGLVRREINLQTLLLHQHPWYELAGADWHKRAAHPVKRSPLPLHQRY